MIRALTLPQVPALGLTASAVDGLVVLRLTGPLVEGTTAALSTWLHRHLPPTAQTLVLDLSAVPDVDATGLGALVAARRRAAEVVVTGAAPAVVRALSRAGALALLRVADEGAVRAA